MAYANPQQYPHIRALKVCLACGGRKHEGLLVCWPCHNALSMQHDAGYGPTMDRVIAHAEALCERRDAEHLQ
jgi:hypothetical protein